MKKKRDHGLSTKYSVKRYDGDDNYSWAVFKREDVKGKGAIIFYGDAKPIVSGMSRNEAANTKRRLEKGDIS